MVVFVEMYAVPTIERFVIIKSSGGFRGVDGGDASPPTSLKVTILAEKSASISNNSAPFRDASPPTDLNVTNPAEKSVSIMVKTFFFFFWKPPEFGRKKTFEFPISAEKSLSVLVKTSEFLRFCASNPPPTKIFWIRH